MNETSDLLPESQRVTIPSPQPFSAVGDHRRSVGEYLIVNERALERRARRARGQSS